MSVFGIRIFKNDYYDYDGYDDYDYDYDYW